MNTKTEALEALDKLAEATEFSTPQSIVDDLVETIRTALSVPAPNKHGVHLALDELYYGKLPGDKLEECYNEVSAFIHSVSVPLGEGGGSDMPGCTSSAVERGSTNGFYVASKAKHFQMWRDLRGVGHPINSTWIDEGEVGATGDFTDLWSRCVSEAASASCVVLYREPDEYLKGALVEIGAAMAMGKPVFAVGEYDGTYHNHPLFYRCSNLQAALDAAGRVTRHGFPLPSSPTSEGTEPAQSNERAASEPPSPINTGEVVAWTTQAQLDKIKGTGNNGVMWGERLPHHPDIPLTVLRPTPGGEAAGDLPEVLTSLTGDGMEVFLDGRNEHGSHITPVIIRSVEADADRDLPDFAEDVLKAAEALGYEIGKDSVWIKLRHNPEQRGGEYYYVEHESYWEFVGICKATTDYLNRVRRPAATPRKDEQ